MECIWDLVGNLKEIRQKSWAFITTNAEEPMASQLKLDYQNIINESIFGVDLDTLITKLENVGQDPNRTEKMAIDVLLEQQFISLEMNAMVPLEGRLLQLYYFFKHAFPNRNDRIHGAMARTILIRNQCITRALLYHSKTGHVINVQPEWYLASLMPVAPAISSPFSLIQILTGNRELRFPWPNAHNATTPYTMGPTKTNSLNSRRSSTNSEMDNSSS